MSESLLPESFLFYRRALRLLGEAEISFLVGGAYAFSHYTGICRHTKDLDVFVRQRDVEAALAAFRMRGFHAEMVFPHWLAKAYDGDDFIDLIFSSGNALCPVDEEWFEHSLTRPLFDVPVALVPPEEMIWQKMFIMERERFDGADVNHLLRTCGQSLDWDRLLRRVGEHGRVLLGHLILFGYAYPNDADLVPQAVIESLFEETIREPAERSPRPCPDTKPCRGTKLCRGTNLSRIQYATDIEAHGYADGRVPPHGSMSLSEATAWTDAGR